LRTSLQSFSLAFFCIFIIPQVCGFVKGFLKKIPRKFFSSSCVPIRLIYLNFISTKVYCDFQPPPHTKEVAQRYLPLTIFIIPQVCGFVNPFFKLFLSFLERRLFQEEAAQRVSFSLKCFSALWSSLSVPLGTIIL